MIKGVIDVVGHEFDVRDQLDEIKDAARDDGLDVTESDTRYVEVAVQQILASNDREREYLETGVEPKMDHYDQPFFSGDIEYDSSDEEEDEEGATRSRSS